MPPGAAVPSGTVCWGPNTAVYASFRAWPTAPCPDTARPTAENAARKSVCPPIRSSSLSRHLSIAAGALIFTSTTASSTTPLTASCRRWRSPRREAGCSRLPRAGAAVRYRRPVCGRLVIAHSPFRNSVCRRPVRQNRNVRPRRAALTFWRKWSTMAKMFLCSTANPAILIVIRRNYGIYL